MEKCGCQKVSEIKFSLHSKTQKHEVLQEVCLHENTLTREQSKESDSMCNGIKTLCNVQFS